MEKNSISLSSPPSPTRSSADRRETIWLIAAAIGIAPVALAGAAIGLLLSGAFSRGDVGIRHLSVWMLVTAQMSGYLFLSAYVLLIIKNIWRRSFAELGFAVPSLRQVGTALLGAAAMIVVVTLLAQLVQTLSHARHEQQAVQIFRMIHDRTLVAYFALMATLAAPFTEELTFRVFIFNVGRRVMPLWGAAIVSGALFALAHQDPFVFIPLTAGGVILCAVYVRTANAWMSMITHACFNGFTLAVLFIAPRSTL